VRVEVEFGQVVRRGRGSARSPAGPGYFRRVRLSSGARAARRSCCRSEERRWAARCKPITLHFLGLSSRAGR
jgi:hypothetical protein